MSRHTFANIVVYLVGSALVVFASCSKSHEDGAETCQAATTMTEALPGTASTLPGHVPDARPSAPEIDWEALCKSVLRNRGGVEDFSSANLIKLMDAEHPSLRAYSALLLATRNERWAIPRLVEALNDELPLVRADVSKALLKMGNRQGIPVLFSFCEKASREYEQGEYSNTSEMMFTAQVLADAGEVAAIPYLKTLSTYERSWGVRIKAVRAFAKLHEKQPSVLKDIASRMEDEDPRVRREATRIVDLVMKTGSAVRKRE